MIQIEQQQEALQSVFTSLDTREPSHKTKGDKKPDFIACDMVQEELILASFKNTGILKQFPSCEQAETREARRQNSAASFSSL